MSKYLILIGLVMVLITGCGSDDGDGDGDGNGWSSSLAACGTGDSPYLGCWVTPGCQSVDNPVNNLLVWSTIRYNFASDGKIYDHVKTYTNSSCVGTPVFDQESFTDFTFSEIGAGPEMLQSGLTGYRLHVEDVTSGGQGVTEVLVAVTANNQLCLSSSLQLASAQSYVLVFDQTPADVDLVNSNCLDAAN